MRTLVMASLSLVWGCGTSSSTDAGASGAGAAGPSASTSTSTSAAGGTGGAGGTGTGGSTNACAPLPAAQGNVVNVTTAQAAQLPSIVANAKSGTTIVLGDGTYALTEPLKLQAPNTTLRGASNDATKVILDAGYVVTEPVRISASNVTVADVTVQRAIDHPIHVYTLDPKDIVGTHLYRLRIIDGGEQFVKVNPGENGGYVDEGKLECSYFELTDAGRPKIESCCGGCYTGGIDAHAAWKWKVRHNTFVNIYCTNGGLAEHAIHFWVGARDTVIENNVIRNCARGIGLGLDLGFGKRVYPDNPYGGVKLAHYDGIVRNNVIYADKPYFDSGIELANARNPLVVHNTVISTDAATKFFSSIDYRFSVSEVRIHNNLTRKITQRDGAKGTVSNNLENTPLGYFVAVPNDFHLQASATKAINAGLSLMPGEAGLDIDGEPHDKGKPDLGADER
jgi:hypothetical protein